MIKSLLLIGIFLIILPFLLGMLYTRFVEDEKNNILWNMAAGYILAFGIFEIVALPLVKMRQSLTMLVTVYGTILLLLAAVSLILNGKRVLTVITDTVNSIRHFTLCIWVELGLIAAQCLVYIRYQYSNADDSFFVAAATTALSTDTIFAFNPYTGAAYKSLPSRYVLSPFYAFTATVSKVTDTHPAIVAHMVFMILFLLLAYAVYTLLARGLFAKDIEKTGYFLLIISALHIFAGYSERTSGLFLLIRLWQGKAILAGILLPLVLYMAIRIFLLGGKKADWILWFFLMSACCMVSSMGIMLGAIMTGLLAILYTWKHKNLRMLVYPFLCCIPNLLCAAIYLVIR